VPKGKTESNKKERTIMEDMLTRFFENLVGRVYGPMHFRVILQPLMATIFAILDGRKDAHAGRAPFFWALFTNPEHRHEMLRSGWKSVGKIFVLALILDAIYQFIVIRWFYPGEALVTACLLAIVPYLLLRGPVNRLTPRKGKEEHHEG
jgi:hypothetical protein